MEDERIKYFEEEFPDIFDGTDALIEAKLKKRELDTDAFIEWKLKVRDFSKAMNEAYPGWQQTWRTPKFQAFLSRVEENTLLEQPNYFYIQKAFRDLDSETVLRFFKVFFSGKFTATPSSNQQFISSQEARGRLRRLAEEKTKGLWRGREREYAEKERELWRMIDGE